MTSGVRAFLTSFALLLGASSAAAQSDISWQLFSDVNAGFDDSGATNPAFAVRGVDFFITAQPSQRLSLLSESVLEVHEDGTVFDLERIYFEYGFTPALRLRVGRTHAPIGYYSRAYHRALLFQMATKRPVLLAFEDEGGMLPAHTDGAELFGDLDVSSAFALKYNIAVGNGRGMTTEDLQANFDRNDWKSVTMRLRAIPTSIDGLEVGGTLYVDKIPAGAEDADGNRIVLESLWELIGGAYAFYRSYPIEVLAETYWVLHRAKTSGTNYHMLGGFVQGTYSIRGYEPYARFEAGSRNPDDPFFNASKSPVDILLLLGGLRVQLDSSALLKFEYTYDIAGRASSLAVQAAFGF